MAGVGVNPTITGVVSVDKLAHASITEEHKAIQSNSNPSTFHKNAKTQQLVAQSTLWIKDRSGKGLFGNGLFNKAPMREMQRKMNS